MEPSVASIQQLHNRIKSGNKSFETILSNTGAMIIDEAHRAVSGMYDGLLNRRRDMWERPVSNLRPHRYTRTP